MTLSKCSCGQEARWCGENNPNPDDDHDCHQIHCDHCGIHFDVVNDASQEAETLAELREIVLKAWNGTVSKLVYDQGFERLRGVLRGVLHDVLDDTDSILRKREKGIRVAIDYLQVLNELESPSTEDVRHYVKLAILGMTSTEKDDA